MSILTRKEVQHKIDKLEKYICKLEKKKEKLEDQMGALHRETANAGITIEGYQEMFENLPPEPPAEPGFFEKIKKAREAAIKMREMKSKMKETDKAPASAEPATA